MNDLDPSMTDLSMNFKSTGVLLQLYVGDALYVPGLLNVSTVGSDGQAHQVIPDSELFCVPWSYLGTLGR